MFANEASNRGYPFLNVPDGHHDLSHHGNDPKKHEKIKAINRFHVEQFAYLLGKLKSMKEGDGTLLDHVMIVYGSGISDGDRHNHDDLPILLAGQGGGTITDRPARPLRRHAAQQPVPLDARPDGRRSNATATAPGGWGSGSTTVRRTDSRMR